MHVQNCFSFGCSKSIGAGLSTWQRGSYAGTVYFLIKSDKATTEETHYFRYLYTIVYTCLRSPCKTFPSFVLAHTMVAAIYEKYL